MGRKSYRIANHRYHFPKEGKIKEPKKCQKDLKKVDGTERGKKG